MMKELATLAFLPPVRRHNSERNRVCGFGIPGASFAMRFYILPAEPTGTTCINFDHVTTIKVTPKSIELYFVGVEAPMVITKTPTSLAQIAKGMDLSEASKDLINNL
jgi:hypothetical protein